MCNNLESRYHLNCCESEEAGITEDIDSLRSDYLSAKLATERERCKFLEIRVQTAMGKLIGFGLGGRKQNFITNCIFRARKISH